MKSFPSLTGLVVVALTLSACGGDDNDQDTANDPGTNPGTNPPATLLVGDYVVENVNQALELEASLVCDSPSVVPGRLTIAQGVATFGSEQIDLANAVSLGATISTTPLDSFGVMTVHYATTEPAAGSGVSDSLTLRISNNAQLEKVERSVDSTIITCTPSVPVSLASPLLALEPVERIKALYAIPEETREQDMSCAVGPRSSLPPATTYHAQLDQLEVTATSVSDPSAQVLRFSLKPVSAYTDIKVYADRGASFNSVSHLGNLTSFSRVSPTGELVELSQTGRSGQSIQERCDQN